MPAASGGRGARPGARRALVLGSDLGHRPDTGRQPRTRIRPALAARWPAAAEQAAFRAAEHIGLDDPDPDAYARELELEAPALEDGW